MMNKSEVKLKNFEIFADVMLMLSYNYEYKKLSKYFYHR